MALMKLVNILMIQSNPNARGIKIIKKFLSLGNKYLENYAIHKSYVSQSVVYFSKHFS